MIRRLSLSIDKSPSTSLESHEAQDRYFELVLAKWKALGGQELLSEQENGPYDQASDANNAENPAVSLMERLTLSDRSEQNHDVQAARNGRDAMMNTLHHVRKLREALTASKRSDIFAAQVYLFAIRAGILLDSCENYHPALQHLLRSTGLKRRLRSRDYDECLSYEVMDMSGRRQQLEPALSLCNSLLYKATGARFKDVSKARDVVTAYVRGSWVAFREARNTATALQRILIRPLEQRLQSHAAMCLTKTYFSIEAAFVPKFFDTTAQSFFDAHASKRGWTMDDTSIQLRKMKAR